MVVYDKWIAAGLDSIQVFQRSATGHITGGLTALTSANTNTYSEGYRAIGANNAPVSRPDVGRVNVPGDDIVLGQFQFAATELPSFTLTMSAMDMDFAEMLTGIAPYDLAGGTTHPGVPDYVTRRNVTLLLSRQAQSQVTGSLGAQMWEHLWLLNCSMVLTSNPFQYQTAATWDWNVTVSKSGVLPWGATTVETYNLPSMTEVIQTATYRMTAGAFVGNNSADTITTIQDPVSAAHAKAYVQTVDNEFASATVSSVGTNSVTLGAAPASGKFAVVVYGFENWEA